MLKNCDEERLGMDLACRAYLYSLFHVAFAGQCDGATLANLFGLRTKELFERANAWRFDSNAAISKAVSLNVRIGKSERSLDECAAEFLGCIDAHAWVSASAQALPGGQAGNTSASLDELSSAMKSDYDKLFQIPGERYVRPWESPYVNVEGTLFQESTLDVRSFYHEASFKLQAEQHFPDDHIAAMMDYLGKMGQRSYDAFADGNDGECVGLLAKQRDFLQAHVLTWVDVFAAKVIENDMRAIYAALASGMAVLAHADEVFLSGVLGEAGEE